MTDIRFREVQRFSQSWPLTLLLLVPLAGVGAAFAGLRDRAPAALIAVFAVTALLPILLFAVSRLTVEVRPELLRVSFVPFRTREVRYADIRRCEAVTYRPIREYGGWGIRWGGPGKWAYNVSGNRGVLLSLADGSTLLIGSQRADELAAAIGARSAAP